jgi:hypothetical protein
MLDSLLTPKGERPRCDQIVTHLCTQHPDVCSWGLAAGHGSWIRSTFSSTLSSKAEMDVTLEKEEQPSSGTPLQRAGASCCSSQHLICTQLHSLHGEYQEDDMPHVQCSLACPPDRPACTARTLTEAAIRRQV